MYDAFLDRADDWLDDYCRYIALKEAHGGRAWTDWEPAVAAREPGHSGAGTRSWPTRSPIAASSSTPSTASGAISAAGADDRGVGLIGDLPIFVAHDGADVWAHRDLFRLGPDGRATHVSGVPPDYFNEDGQSWGNPLYRWETHRKDDFAWWCRRIAAALGRFDVLRFDHFRGLDACYAIPADAENAADKRCTWDDAPGDDLLAAVRKHLNGRLPLIAEDLGVITPEVEALRDGFELPGMRVLQFAFGDDPLAEVYLPHTYIRRCVAYTGTHDNDTTRGWFEAPPGTTTQPPEEVEAERLVRPPLPRARRRRRRPPRPRPARLGLGRRHGDRPLAGYPRPRLRGPDEHPRDRRGQLVLAVRRRGPDARGPRLAGRADRPVRPLERRPAPVGDRPPLPAAEAGGGRARRVQDGTRNRGSRTVKVLPAPGWLSTAISPPRPWTTCLTIERPRPVPPRARLRALSTR